MTEPETIKALYRQLTRAPLKSFPTLRQRLEAPEELGVYVIYCPRGQVLHVGRTPRAKGGIAQRLRNHMCAASSFTKRYLNGDGALLRDGYKFRCLPVPDGRQCALLEAYAVGRLCPAHIGLGSGGDT